jgi:hypothetical protein
MKRALLNFVVIAGLAALAPMAAAQGTGSLFVIHGIPGLPMDVDVYANGAYVDSFGFAESLGPLNLPADSYYLEVKFDGIPILSANADVMDGGNYTAIAHLTEQGGIALSLFENDDSEVEMGRVRLTVRHTAQAPEVALRLGRGENDVDVVTVPGLANSTEIGPVVVRGSKFNAGLWLGDTEVFNSGLLELNFRTPYIVYAIGKYPETFQLFVQVP